MEIVERLMNEEAHRFVVEQREEQREASWMRRA